MEPLLPPEATGLVASLEPVAEAKEPVTESGPIVEPLTQAAVAVEDRMRTEVLAVAVSSSSNTRFRARQSRLILQETEP